LALVHLGVLSVLSTANNPIPAIQTQVQKVLDLQAEVWNTSFSFGYSSGFGSVALVAVLKIFGQRRL